MKQKSETRSAWQADCPSVSTRDVIRILLEHNLSRGIARCADSLISRVRGDKYRRDTSPKQTAYADWTRQKRVKEASCSKRGTKSYRDVDDEESKRETERDRRYKRGG